MSGMRYLISAASLLNKKSLAGSLGRTLLGLKSVSAHPYEWQLVSRRADEAETLQNELTKVLQPGTQSTFDSIVRGSITPKHVDDIANEMVKAKATGLVLLPDAIDVSQWTESQTLLAAAKAANLQHLVLVSTCAAHPSSLLPSGQAWAELEKQASDTQLPVSIIHHTTLMQSMLCGLWAESICNRTLSVAMDRARISFVDAADVAEVVNHVLAQPHPSSILSLTGPAALSWDEVASTFSRHLDTPLRLSKVPLWVVQPSMWIRGKSADDIRETINHAKYYEAGGEAQVTSTVEEILGRAPRTFESFVEFNKEQWPRPHGQV
ncbi:hypothetical protein AC1031_000858 [Aphanomyces cochlioides]|nr:hypothetical protein AC1031_000858 [Aphanomyces cochlioides]